MKVEKRKSSFVHNKTKFDQRYPLYISLYVVEEVVYKYYVC